MSGTWRSLFSGRHVSAAGGPDNTSYIGTCCRDSERRQGEKQLTHAGLPWVERSALMLSFRYLVHITRTSDGPQFTFFGRQLRAVAAAPRPNAQGHCGREARCHPADPGSSSCLRRLAALLTAGRRACDPEPDRRPDRSPIKTVQKIPDCRLSA